MPTPLPAKTSETASPYRQSIAGCLSESVGNHGLDKAALGRWLDAAAPHLDTLKEDARSGRLALFAVANDTADIDEAAAALARLAEGAQTLVFFGTGGSGLGGQTLAQLAGWGIPTGSAANGTNGPRARTRFFDNLDGLTLERALTNYNLATTRFIAISKSGGTTGTLAQTIAAISAVRAAGLGERIPKLFLGLTEAERPGKANGLRTLLASLGVPMLEHNDRIGGRYSCLTNVGLLPAIARGLDARRIRAGAQGVVEAMLASATPADFAPAVGAATAIGLSKERGIRTLVMMPYADRLGRFAEWFVQLWAESLGKNGEGTTPVPALGPLDQHSQLQLFMDGPREIYLTLVRVATQGVGPTLDAKLAEVAGIGFIAGRTVGDIVDAQGNAVAEALAQAGRPVRTIDIARLDEESIGALLMHFMIETILAGRLLGIDPFDQPAVELAKTLTRERLSR